MIFSDFCVEIWFSIYEEEGSMRNLCYSCSVVVLILTFMVHQGLIDFDKGIIPYGFLLSIILLIVGAIVAAKASHNIDFLFNDKDGKR